LAYIKIIKGKQMSFLFIFLQSFSFRALRLIQFLGGLLFLFVSQVSAQETRVVGGEEAIPGEFPFMAVIQYRGEFRCGASLLNDRWLLTAAHCVPAPAREYTVVLGAHNLSNLRDSQLLAVRQIIIHPNYASLDRNSHDLALIELDGLAERRFKPVKIASSSDALPGTLATVAGWGALADGGPISSLLQKVDVPVVSNSDCLASYGRGSIHEHNVCAGFYQGGYDSCAGDSGGPLFFATENDFFQVGIVSWGLGCGLRGFYGVYTDPRYFVDWIQSHTGSQWSTEESICYGNRIRLNIQLDGLSHGVEWQLTNENGEIVSGGGQYRERSFNSELIDLKAGAYLFEVRDALGVGLRGGYYELIDDRTGAVIHRGQNFGRNERTEICIQPERDFSCFAGYIDVLLKADQYGEETSWQITDTRGAVITEGGNYIGFDVDVRRIDLPSGEYLFSLFDSYGDGFLQSSTSGSEKSAGYVVAGQKEIRRRLFKVEGNFGSSSNTPFCIE
jgi:hypothetical protein